MMPKNRPLLYYCIFAFILLVCQLNAQTVRNDAVRFYQMGREALNQNRILDAIQFFQQSSEYNENYSDAYRETARAFYYLDELDEAEDYIMQALNLAPLDSRNLNLHGRILITGGKFDEAEIIFTDIISRERFNVEARIGLGELSAARGDIVQAREYYQDSLDLFPDDYRVLLSLAFVYQEQGRLNRAEDYITAALDIESQNPWVYIYAANFFMRIGELSEAEPYALRALNLQENFIPALEILSRIYVKLEKYESAQLVLDQLDINALADNAHTLYTRALVEYYRNRTDEALRTLETILRDNPDNEIARLLLEDILLNEKDFDDPQRITHADFHFARALEYVQRNQNQSARYHYNRGLMLEPFSPEGRRSYARFFRETGEYAQYVNQINFLRQQISVNNTSLDDDYEIYTDLLRNSVSRKWKTDQFTVERDKFNMILFTNNESRVLHNELDRLIASLLMDQLYSSTRIDFAAQENTAGAFSFEPVHMDSDSEAFIRARTEQADYYLFLVINERTDSITASAELHLGRTGRMLQNFVVSRSGNTRIKDTVFQLSAHILQALPIRGSILERNFETALINLGQKDGLIAGDSLNIIKSADLAQNHVNLNFTYRQEDIVGTATVNRVDVLLSEVEIEPAGFFDNVNRGDTVFSIGNPEIDDGITDNNSGLYELLRDIR